MDHIQQTTIRLLRVLFFPVLLFALLVLVPVAAHASGTVTYLEGEVAILRGSDRFLADFGTEVHQGDQVTTGRHSTVIISLEGRADIKLRDDSEVTLDQIGTNTQVGLHSGGIFSRVRERMSGRYEVRAGSVVGGVRGTEYFVAYGRRIEEAHDVWLCVNVGEVQLEVATTGAEMPVRAGEGVNVLAGSRLTDARRYRWTERLNWNMDPDAGDVFDTTDLDAAYSDLLDQDYD